MTDAVPLEILLVEDDSQIRRFLRASLLADQYKLVEALTVAEGIAQATSRLPDLILLDLGLPDGDGLKVIRHVRKTSRVPIIVLSARDKDKDKITALDLGADDYVPKPFSMGELSARIRAALRRSAQLAAENVSSEYRFGDVVVYLEKRTVKRFGAEVHLTPHEFKLLATLVRHPGRVLTQRELLNEVWGTNHSEQAHYLRVYMAQLRRKLEKDPAQPQYFITEPGVGYRLDDSTE